MYQQITLIGNLGSDPEMRFTPTGVPVATFSLAVTRTWVNNQGERQEKTVWTRVTCWRKLAEFVSQYLTKGRQVLVVGELEEPRAWIDKKTGDPRAGLEITATTVQFVGNKPQSENGTGTGNYAAPAAAPAEPVLAAEDIPF